MVLENKYKGDIKYEDSVQSTVVCDFDVGG